MIEPRGLAGEGTSQPSFAGAGLAGDDEIFFGLQPSALGELQDVASIETTSASEVDIFDAGVREAQLCCGQAVGQTPIGAHGNFAIQHQSEPFVAAERGGIVLLGQLPIGGRHSGKTERLHLVKCGICQHQGFLSVIDSKCRHGCWRAGAWL